MKMNATRIGLLFLIVFVVAVVEAHIGKFDESWKERADKANKAADAAYTDKPEDVMNKVNRKVHKATEGTEGSNSTRRELKGRAQGPCMATNPIDRCWRCDKNWAQHREKIVDCVQGFGRKTTGGKGGKVYVVTDPSDSDLINPKPGTLRHAVIQTEPLWIIFAHSMVIRLSEELLIASNKTIDGRGAQVHIAFGAQITAQFVQNIIITNLHIHHLSPGNGGMIRDSVNHYGFRTRSDGDGISLFGASNVWIDHCSMVKCTDGLIDAVEGSTAITISNCHFTDHNEVMLFGASDGNDIDKRTQITVAFNHFGKGLVQRMPRCRWGFFHILNNDYTHWLMYAVGGSSNPTLFSQGNRYIAPDDINAKRVVHRNYATEGQYKNWVWKSDGDLLMNGAIFEESGDPNAKILQTTANLISPKPGSYVTRLTRYAGCLSCFEGKPC